MIIHGCPTKMWPIVFTLSIFLLNSKITITQAAAVPDDELTSSVVPMGTYDLSTLDSCEELIPGTVSCTGLVSPASISRLVPLTTTHLTITHSNLTGIAGDIFLPFTLLTTLELVTSCVVLDPSPWPASLPLRHLTLNSCWSSKPDPNEVFQGIGTRPGLQLTGQVWSNLSSLQELRLSHSRLLEAEDDIDNLPRNTTLILHDSELSCHLELTALVILEELGLAIVPDNTTCFTSSDIRKFNPLYTFNNKPLMNLIKQRKELRDRCPHRCSCELHGFRSDIRPLISVNCSGLGLTVLPTFPNDMTSLFMDHNKLQSVDDLFRNPNYSRLAKLDFSNNDISSVDGHALVKYLTSRGHDIKFNLRNNSLTTFPVWELATFYNNAYRNDIKHVPALDLSGNPYDCDNCSFSPYFKSFIYENMFHIPDHMDVKCKTGENILYMDFMMQCNPAASPLLAIDYLNILLALMLIALLADFAYNFYQYRRHGKLPWIVRVCKIC